jgi:hypothetical protein
MSRKRWKREKRVKEASEAGESLRLVHHHPGYLRARAKAFESTDDDEVVAAARSAAEGTEGFRSWAHNAGTGSIVVQYDPGAVECDDLLKHIAKSAGLPSVEFAGGNGSVVDMSREELVGEFMDAVQRVNGAILVGTGGRADLRELVPIALVATSAVSLVLNKKCGLLPSWEGPLYHAYRIFMQWHRKEAKDRERSDEADQDESAER